MKKTNLCIKVLVLNSMLSSEIFADEIQLFFLLIKERFKFLYTDVIFWNYIKYNFVKKTVSILHSEVSIIVTIIRARLCGNLQLIPRFNIL